MQLTSFLIYVVNVCLVHSSSCCRKLEFKLVSALLPQQSDMLLGFEIFV
jgi:hypothetical protein